MTTNRSIGLYGSLTAAALLAACASTPVPPPELLQARSAVRAAEADARVLSSAPLELKKASDTLRRADELSARGESLAEVTSTAYVASRQAETAVAVAQAKANDDAIRSAEVDRERARADARASEARRAQAQAQAARGEAAAAQQQMSTAQQQAAAAQQQAEAARMHAGDAEARAMAARREAQAAQASASSAQQQAAALQQQLEELKANKTDRGMLVTLGDVLFEFGRADIKPGSEAALRKLADYLQQHAERRVLIEGFTDSVGSDAYNLDLSQRRAQAVATALAGMGVAAGRIETRGYGKAYPVADNSSDTNRAMNRRVEVYISDNDQPVRARG